MPYRFAGSGTICGVNYVKKLRRVEETNAVEEIDVTGGGDTYKCYEAGLSDDTLTFEALGECPPVGTTGSVSVSWGDGTTTVWNKAVVTNRRKTGSVGAAVVYTGTVRKTE